MLLLLLRFMPLLCCIAVGVFVLMVYYVQSWQDNVTEAHFVTCIKHSS